MELFRVAFTISTIYFRMEISTYTVAARLPIVQISSFGQTGARSSMGFFKINRSMMESSSDSVGNPMESCIIKRSNWASGKVKVPAVSMGF